MWLADTCSAGVKTAAVRYWLVQAMPVSTHQLLQLLFICFSLLLHPSSGCFEGTAGCGKAQPTGSSCCCAGPQAMLLPYLKCSDALLRSGASVGTLHGVLSSKQSITHCFCCPCPSVLVTLCSCAVEPANSRPNSPAGTAPIASASAVLFVTVG